LEMAKKHHKQTYYLLSKLEKASNIAAKTNKNNNLHGSAEAY